MIYRRGRAGEIEGFFSGKRVPPKEAAWVKRVLFYEREDGRDKKLVKKHIGLNEQN